MLRFTPIDVELHGRECVAFRADSFAVSFGSSERFFSEWGKDGERYLDHLRTRMRELPGSCVHAWQGGRLVGQIELRGGREDPSEGYVNLYYLVPEARGTGVAPDLDRYAITWFSALGLSRAALGVNPSNARAIAFYLKQGWCEAGLHPRHPDVSLMRRAWARP